MTTRHTNRYSALALSMACALMLPLAGHAQSDAREQRTTFDGRRGDGKLTP